LVEVVITAAGWYDAAVFLLLLAQSLTETAN
jgi:hypothetical protein